MSGWYNGWQQEIGILGEPKETKALLVRIQRLRGYFWHFMPSLGSYWRGETQGEEITPREPKEEEP